MTARIENIARRAAEMLETSRKLESWGMFYLSDSLRKKAEALLDNTYIEEHNDNQ